MTSRKYGVLTAWLIAGWFVFALAASAMRVFMTAPGQPQIPVGLAVTIPIAVFSLWYVSSPHFRLFLHGLSPLALTLVQSWRTAGFVFLVLYSYGILPGVFALPAGWGDIAVGVTAPIVAMRFAHARYRKLFLVWQVAGIVDLVMAIVLGTTAPFITSDAAATTAMTELPMSLIPTFAVPLLLILHIICIVQAVQWHGDTAPGNGQLQPSPA